eukprot:CAMPEP_0174849648 /NCGR_PEP_ID=MMETSP1114-20130205/16683_1 /TAXON_ID=312471 /ORGANISM="Neobodo designis, Strain CCAP 1951/1" /LENGTH=90 /DNA_ID=CAMNT_0016084027 /DNA_START=33 /DNA_END=305 /DNA_ORIENTATION=+
MSTSAAKVAPKTFTQVKNVTSFLAVVWGGLYGWKEKSTNDALWWKHHTARWAKTAEEQAEARRAAAPPSEIPEIVPAELHDTYKALAGTA